MTSMPLHNNNLYGGVGELEAGELVRGWEEGVVGGSLGLYVTYIKLGANGGIHKYTYI